MYGRITNHNWLTAMVTQLVIAAIVAPTIYLMGTWCQSVLDSVKWIQS